MPRYNLLRLIAAFGVIDLALLLYVSGLAGWLGFQGVLLGGLVLVLIALGVGYVVGNERPEEKHEACEPRSCIHRRHTHRRVS